MAETPEPKRFLDEAQRLLPAAIALRRRIHAKPELGLNLPLTTEAVLEGLRGLDVGIAQGPSTSGLIVSLSGTRPGSQSGRTILLRDDMDALPMPEETGLEFASEIAGRMHACGHDAHTAMLVQAVHLLHRHRDELAGTVKFMLQPGEGGPCRRPPRLAGGIIGSINAHSPSVRSLGYRRPLRAAIRRCSAVHMWCPLNHCHHISRRIRHIDIHGE